MYAVVLFARSNVIGIRCGGFGNCNNDNFSEKVGVPVCLGSHVFDVGQEFC